MRKLFAIGTLLLSSAAVMVSPAAASDRNTYVNNQNNQDHGRGYSAPAPVNSQNYSRGYSAPVPNYSSYSNGGRFDREEQARVDWRVREERLERERREHARRDWNDFHSFRERY